MRNMFLAIVVACALLCGCGNAAIFAPSLRDTAPQAQALPWWGESGPVSVDTTAPAEPAPRSDYPSPIQVGDMVITHSGLWQLEASEETPEGTTAFLRSDQDWVISVMHLRTGAATQAVLNIQQEVEDTLTLIVRLVASGMMSDPEVREQLPEGIPEDQLLPVLTDIATRIMGIDTGPLTVAEYTPDAASYTVTVQGRTTVVYGLCTDFDDPTTAVVLVGDWEEDAGPLPLTELTEIARDLRIASAGE